MKGIQTALYLAVLLLPALMARAAAGGRGALRHSDVIAFCHASPETYAKFSVSVVSWGGHPDSEKEIEDFRNWAVIPAHKMGIKYVGGVGMVTEFALFMKEYPDWKQARCLDVHGKPFTVPWLWDHSYQGEPAWWFCTNDPHYREFLKRQVVLAAEAGVDGIHVDDHLGSAGTYWLDGCFCDDCIAGFRKYLRKYVSPQRLQQLGIEDLDSFNYREYVASWLQAHPGEDTFSAPLGEEYLKYQHQAAAELMAELRRAAEKAAGHPLSFSANAAPPDPMAITDYPVLTQFSAEVPHHGGLDDYPPYVYKVSAALGLPMIATAGGKDWAKVKAEHRTGLVRAWIAQAYAFGQYFMVPHHQWCYSDKLGTHWYDGPPEKYGPLYAFVRNHRDLFDDMDSVAQVAVLYSSAAARAGRHEDREAARALLSADIPFDMIAAGDDWLPARITMDMADRFQRVIVPPNLTLSGDQQRVLEALSAEGKLVKWKGPQTLAELPDSWVKVNGADNVWALLRKRRNGSDVVCHLLTRNYDPKTDATPDARGLSLSIAAEVFGGKLPARATLYAPGREPAALPLSVQAGRVTVTIPHVSEWAVVHFGGGEVSAPPAVK